ncbi:hypothetical protein [Erwinia sorbitola]|uniref:Uncharacterized protein n=1 Tax=Erwinia sorbitola TaxID=2681984 RepID=A0A6I6EWB9_9GAMM|nr:hypothetical protein [Erwinia sorbitola]MTD27085.1 hypothetical protein [Erwinia sorbitola]QGU88643.1 hypothetical protein GN242_16060 [Erwinia sorbitola]
MRKTIPLKYRQTELNPLELMEELQQIIPKIEDDLVGSLDWYSQNARYVPDSIRIISLEHLQQSRYKLNYSFRWNVFNACLDIDAFETTNQSVNFSCGPDALVFEFIDNDRHAMSDEL